MPKVTDEQIISALLNNRTMKEAAASIGLTERTVYTRMQEDDFKVLYKAVKADLIRGSVFSINQQLGAALDTVVEIMQDKNVSPAIRLQAADKIFLYADKFATRLSKDEHSVSQQISSNNFHIDLSTS